MLKVALNPVKRAKLQKATGLKDRENFVNKHLNPLLDEGLLEMTIPDTPNSPDQKYRLTDKGKALLASLKKGAQND